MAVKTKQQAQANFEASTTYIPSRYEAGVRAADWQTKAASDQAEQNYAAGVQKAIAAKSRQNKIRNVSNTDWQNAAATKGAPIIGDRIRQAVPKWAANWGPIYDSVVTAIGSMRPRTVDYKTNITNRLIPTVEAWKKAAGKL